jgi:hypothetical protein
MYVLTITNRTNNIEGILNNTDQIRNFFNNEVIDAPINNLTEKPELNVENPLLCCNQQRKARQRVLPTSTNVKKNYYQTNYMYLYNRI